MSRRRGVSLAELLVVMSLVTVIISLSARLMHRIMHAQTNANAFLDGERNALRLSSQFRRDVQTALEVLPTDHPDDGVLTLRYADQRLVHYQITGREVVRTVSGKDDHLARESFHFPSDLTCHIEQHSTPQRIVLSLDSASQTGQGSGQIRSAPLFQTPFYLRLEACLARETRFAGKTAIQESAK